MTSSNSQMHNDIMAASSKEHLPMLARGEIFKEKYGNTTPEKQILIDSEAEAVHIILNGILFCGCFSLGYNEKMMLFKQESKGIPLSAEQSKWLQDTDKDPDKQELEAYYIYMAKIQEVLHATNDNSGPTYDAEPFEKVDQNADEHEDERLLLTSLIANLKLDFDENKKIQ
nr:hypothetical protein [Tanacetum cinerariifolium]